MKKKLKIMLIVGEMSGDAHAAKLVSAMQKALPHIDLEFFGATGEHMRAKGVETIVKADDFARVGIIEVGMALPMFLNVFSKLKKSAFDRKPDAVILIDFPEFNLRFVRSIKKLGIKTIYYVSPQIWAWRKGRVEIIKKYVDLLLTILPFENKFYTEKGFHNVEYVGNPLAGEVKSELNRKEFCEKHNLNESDPLIALIPGSRRNEISRILPIMLETASLMSDKDSKLQFVIALASNRSKSEVNSAINKAVSNGFEIPKQLRTIKNETYEVIKSSDAAAVTSGTATLETALLGTPMAIVYKVSKLNYLILKNFISIEHIGLVNLIAQEKVCTELIQDDFDSKTLTDELFRILDKTVNRKLRSRLGEIEETLGKGGASKNAAAAIIRELDL